MKKRVIVPVISGVAATLILFVIALSTFLVLSSCVGDNIDLDESTSASDKVGSVISASDPSSEGYASGLSGNANQSEKDASSALLSVSGDEFTSFYE